MPAILQEELQSTIPTPITTTNVASARGINNINFTNLSISNATTLTNPNATIQTQQPIQHYRYFWHTIKLLKLPIPSTERMFTPDKAQIIRHYQDPLIFEIG